MVTKIYRLVLAASKMSKIFSGAFVATATVLASALAIGLKLAHFATPGWFSVALGILLLVFLQTGALTLMTLMLTGVVRAGAPNQIDYHAYIEQVEQTR